MQRVAACLVAWLMAAPVAGQETATAAPATARPRVGLVLSGGGARGAAHVGVLKVLEELRVPIDAIAGTSMGAVVGGLYASGMTAAEIEQLMATVDWQDAFSDRAARQDLDFRRKQDDRDFLVRVPLGLKGRKFLLPRGLISGQKLGRILRERMLPVAELTDFDQLPVPFRAVATDLENGERVVLGSGDLPEAVRASMSAPGVFTPVERDGQLLVDGGVSENLPIDVARAMGVDRLIVVDVTFGPMPRGELASAIDVSNQMVALLIRRDTLRQRKTLQDGDVVIDPELGSLGSTEFDRLQDARGLGEAAARGQAARLQEFAVDAESWQRWEARRSERVLPQPEIRFVDIAPESQRYAPRIEAALRPLLGQPLDVGRLDHAMSRLYGDDIFETLDYRLVQHDDSAGLFVRARRKSYGPNYVRFGLQLEDDFEGGTSYTIGVRFQITEANRYGAEWVTDLSIGQNPGVFAEFYQPLGYVSPWFIAPRATIGARDLEVLTDNRRVASYRVRESELGLDFGRELGNWGEARIGLLRGDVRQAIRVGEPAPPALPESAQFETGGAFVRFSVDTLNSTFFPRTGGSLEVEWNAGRTALGADYDSDTVRLDALLAESMGRNTLALWATAGTAVSGPTPSLGNYFSLGGLFNLSGRPQNSLNGPHYGIARAMLYRQIGRGGPGFLNVPTFAGLSLEWGNVWQQRSDVEFGDGDLGGSVFLGLDTLLGPLYLAAGVDEDGSTAFYLLLGKTF